MHRSLKPHAQAKKVPPPAIPGDPIPQQYIQQIPLFRLGGSISSGTGKQLDDGIRMSSLVSSPSLEEGGFNLPRETSVALRMKDEISDYATTMAASVTSQTSNTSATTNTKQSAAQVGLTTAGAVNPLLSGCPPSIVPCPPPVFCATLREPLTHKAAVYYHQQLALQEDQGIDLTQSPGRDSPGSSSGSAGSGSRHSTASLDSGRASSYLTGVSGASIRGSGNGALSSPRCSSVSSCSIGSVDRQRNDELIIDWLMEMKYEEYAQLFIAAGYDLPTIARMTPEDLTAIGIKNPHHRERIKQRIDKLQVLDNLPHFVPGSIEEWLQLLRLEEYIQPLLDQNYKTVRDVTQVTWEDLEDIGIVKLGHQKKILLAIKRVKDIISGKWNPGGSNSYQQQEYRKAWPNAVPIPTTPTHPYLPTTRVSWDDSKIYASTGDAYYCTGSNHECCNGNDVVLIKVRQPRGKSLESLEDIHDNSTRSHLTFSHYTATDYGHFSHPTQLQQHQQSLQQQQHLQQQQQQALMSGAGAGAGGGGGNRILGNPATMSYITGSPITSKKIAPEPPRRHCSIRNSRNISTDATQIQQQTPQQALHPLAQNIYYGTSSMPIHHHGTAGYLQQQQQNSQPIYANYATIQQTTAEIHCEKFHDNKSNSSIDSIDTIPFANENTGTIKQRLLNRQDMTISGQGHQQTNAHLHSSSSSSSSSSTNTIANLTHSFHSLKSSTSLHDASSLIRSDSIGSNTSGGSAGAATSMVLLRSPTLQYPPDGITTANSCSIITTTVEMHAPTIVSGTGATDTNTVTGTNSNVVTASNAQKVSVNVLNDIGNMLANLTDELDAMLEEEKRVGLNIDSE